MANLRKYEIDAVVEQILSNLKDHKPDYPNFEKSKYFKKFQELRRKQDALEKEQEDIRDKIFKEYNLPSYYHRDIVSSLKLSHNNKYAPNRRNIERQVILSGNTDLNEIIIEVTNKLKK